MEEYQSIYANQCVYCTLEGSYHCKLEIENNECKNFNQESKVFGGY